MQGGNRYSVRRSYLAFLWSVRRTKGRVFAPAFVQFYAGRLGLRQRSAIEKSATPECLSGAVVKTPPVAAEKLPGDGKPACFRWAVALHCLMQKPRLQKLTNGPGDYVAGFPTSLNQISPACQQPSVVVGAELAGYIKQQGAGWVAQTLPRGAVLHYPRQCNKTARHAARIALSESPMPLGHRSRP